MIEVLLLLVAIILVVSLASILPIDAQYKPWLLAVVIVVCVILVVWYLGGQGAF